MTSLDEIRKSVQGIKSDIDSPPPTPAQRTVKRSVSSTSLPCSDKKLCRISLSTETLKRIEIAKITSGAQNRSQMIETLILEALQNIGY